MATNTPSHREAFSGGERRKTGRMALIALVDLEELTTDIDASDLTSKTEEFMNLARAVERLYDR